jgi:O-antigen ligase
VLTIVQFRPAVWCRRYVPHFIFTWRRSRFETIDLGIPVLELTMVSFFVLVGSLIFQPDLALRKPPVAFGLFVLYVIVFTIPTALGYTPVQEEAEWQLKVLIHLVIMGWVVFNIMKNQEVARTGLIVLGVACATLAALQVTGISETNAGYESTSDRTTSFGFHPNNLARILALGMLAIVGLAYGTRRGLKKLGLLVPAFILLIGYAIIQTGSRGGLLALFAGLMVIVLGDGSARSRARNAVLVGAAVLFIAGLAITSELTASRFENALDDGDLARRELIYPMAWEMFLEKPLVGWGGKASEYELGARLGHPEEESKNPHNLILYLLVATGLVGAVPMLAGIGLALYAAWSTRTGGLGVLPLAMLVTVLVANMSGLWLHNKMHWFVIALALSTVSVVRGRQFREQGG